jgi:hypothetical protein
MDDVVYSRVGQGEPLVLIHGVGHRRQAWNRWCHCSRPTGM